MATTEERELMKAFAGTPAMRQLSGLYGKPSYTLPPSAKPRQSRNPRPLPKDVSHVKPQEPKVQLKVPKFGRRKSDPTLSCTLPPGGKKSYVAIESTSNGFERDKAPRYKPVTTRDDLKLKLQKTMEYGGELPMVLEKAMFTKELSCVGCARLGSTCRACERKERERERERERSNSLPTEVSPKQRFEELVAEIDERASFLAEMQALGEGKKYEKQIKAEIGSRVAEMTRIDQERNRAELQR